MKYSILFGSKLIEDILHPDPASIDVEEISLTLARIRRFSADRRALTVYQHVYLCLVIARARHEPTEVYEYLCHHEDHEAILGDIPGPLKSIIATKTDILERIEDALDEAIWIANHRSYWRKSGKPEDEAVLATGKGIDKVAETIEWVALLDQPQKVWNQNILVERNLPAKALEELPRRLCKLLGKDRAFEARLKARLDPDRLLEEQRSLGLVG